MGRRVVSARDQVEMLSPWRTAERAEKFEWIRGSGGNWELSTRTPDGQRVIVDTSPSRGQYTTAARPTYGPDKLMGININDTLQDFTGQILSGEKTVETRDTRSLHPYVGRRIGILSTHDTRSKPRVTYLVGFATVGEPKFYDNADDFDADYDLHRVASGSDFHIDNAKHGVKWGYPVHDVKRIDPVAIDAKGNVARDLTPYMHLAKLLYHRTTPENADAINQARRFNPGRGPDAVFFSTNPGDDAGQARGYGDGLVTLNIPDHHFADEYGEFQGGQGWLDDEFPSGEQHWAIPHHRLDPEWFVTKGSQA